MLAQELYKQMFLIRTFEEKLLELFSFGEIKGTVHTCLGQEACAVGVMNAINKDLDVVFSNHRAHGHIIAYGAPIKPVMAEIMGKASGLCKGIGGSQHLHWKNFYTNGIQGGLVSIAVGAALAEKFKKSGAVIVIFLGDGTLGQGIVYEAFNLSSLWDVPVLFVLENNKYAQTTPVNIAHAGIIEDRAKPFGIQSKVIDGNDAEGVYREAYCIVESIRKEHRPYFLVLDTYRLGPHSKGDDTRNADELEHHKGNDPLLRLAKKIDASVREESEDEIRELVNRTVEEIKQDSRLSFKEFAETCCYD